MEKKERLRIQIQNTFNIGFAILTRRHEAAKIIDLQPPFHLYLWNLVFAFFSFASICKRQVTINFSAKSTRLD
jgi:hypothetical protein